MQVSLYNQAGEVVGNADLDDAVWGIEPNMAVMHQAVVRLQANRRQGTHSTKSRGEVRGGGVKPYKQKGTGRARQGSRRAPHYKGGGVVFGPKPRSYRQDMPKKMRRLALRSALSSKVRDEEIRVCDALAVADGRTKSMLAILSALGVNDSALVVLPPNSAEVVRAARNVPRVKTVPTNSLNVLDVLKYKYLLLPQAAIATVEEILRPAAKRPALVSGDGTEA